MKKIVAAILFSLVLASTSFAQSVTLPKEIKGMPGSWIIVAPEAVDGGAVKWRIDPRLQDVRLDLIFPPEMVARMKGKVVTGPTGVYKIEAWNAKGDVASDIAVCWLTIGTPGPVPPGPNPPDPGPGPGPNPPDPGPGPGPNPPGPVTPILGDGYRVLIVYETNQIFTPGQQAVISGKKVRDFLNSNCTPTTDGGKRGFYIVDKDVNMTNESKIWRDGLARNRVSIPWIIISSPLGNYEGPVTNEAETIALLAKYKG